MGPGMKSVFAAHMGLVLAGLFSFVLMGAGQSLYGPALRRRTVAVRPRPARLCA